MTKTELKDLAKRYFNLQEIETTNQNISEEKFAVAHLIDGTKVMNDKDSEFAVGDALFVETAEGEKVQAPAGEHELEGGIVVTVSEEGVITGIDRPGEGGEGSLESAPEEMAKEKMEDEMVEAVSSEDLIQAISELVMPEIEGLKKEMASYKEKMAKMEEAIKVYMSAQPASESKTNQARFSKVSKTNFSTSEPARNKARYNGLLNTLIK